ncbi:hypothetical protein JVU11DRAFT_4570 [Chiua virens]|nr:hypothetical protein JVU11DRAFT_4570 [Chiua virens]
MHLRELYARDVQGRFVGGGIDSGFGFLTLSNGAAARTEIIFTEVVQDEEIPMVVLERFILRSKICAWVYGSCMHIMSKADAWTGSIWLFDGIQSRHSQMEVMFADTTQGEEREDVGDSDMPVVLLDQFE